MDTFRKIFLLIILIQTILFLPTEVNAQRTPPVAYIDPHVNFIRTWDAKAPEQDGNNLITRPLDDVQQSTQYFDGLGRSLQTVVKEGSMVTGETSTDLVSAVEYDEFGREQFKYLPFAANNKDENISITDGLFKLNPFQQQAEFYSNINSSPIKNQEETWFYRQTVFENSPLNRIEKSMAPGNSWVGGNLGTEAKYYINTDIDAVRIWEVTDNSATGAFGTYESTAAYSAGELYKNVTIDENIKQIIEFKDKEGKVILKKVQLEDNVEDDGTGKDHTDWLCTYYIYDDLNNLRCVIQPRGVELISTNWVLTDATILAEQCFRYEYDQRNRMIMKKVPGAGEVNMVYDTRDRLVMTQDANLAVAPAKWMVTLYDNLNRPVQTGLLLNSFNNKTFVQNLTDAAASSAYPFTETTTPATTYWEKLSVAHYDDYIGVPSPLSGTFNSTYINSTNFITIHNASPDYAQPMTQSTAVKGMVTWSQTKVLGTASQFISQVNFYDAKGRLIQVQSVNQTTGVDIATNQYDFSGKVIRTHLFHQKSGGTVQTYQAATKNIYDILGRPIKIEKNFNNAGYKTIAAMEYDALGQMKKKSIGTNPDNTSQSLETVIYDYNIRGWLLGANRDYAKNKSSVSNKFGFDLGYDKGSIANTTGGAIGTYATPAFNGNISGTVWKSAGDGEIRKYDFNYDAVNRLMKADFNQYTGALFDKSANVDFSMKMGNGINASTAYDANGNILSMTQNGLKLNSSQVIDQLTYEYKTVGTITTNKLSKVSDAIIAADNGSLGDFKDGANGTTDDYNYDPNGNLILDNNKKISSITYNYLNLPSVISITGKGTITYTYDAAGNKLKKVTLENASAANNNITTTTTTNYIGGIVYETRTDNNAQTTDYTDKLQFIAHEEGRIRKKDDGTFAYDYSVKDHLGNVRMVLTEEQKIDHYPTATLEGTGASNPLIQEQEYYDIDGGFVVDKPTNPNPSNLLDYINDNGTNNPNTFGNRNAVSQKMYRLNTATNRSGYSRILKVMAGDKIDILAKSYYRYNSGTISKDNLLATDIIHAFLEVTGGGNPAVQHGATNAILSSNNTGLVLPLNSFSDGNPENVSNHVKSGLSYIVFDERFNYVTGDYDPVESASSGGLKNHFIQNINIPKNGYIYIYCSNESNIDVFFDNLEVVHTHSPILEETHYYPFGLTMAGISSKAAGTLQNKEKTFQGQRFDDDLGLNWVQFKWRNHDPQIGRFIEIDPLAEKYVYNSTYAFSENKVTSHVELEGLEALEFMKLIYDNVSDGLYRTGEWINDNLNPVVNAVELATGKSNESNFTEPKPRINSLTELGIYLFPGSKLEGAAAKAIDKTIVKMTEKTVVKTATGTEIKGFVKHGVNQAIERGVKPTAIKDAIKNPLKIGKVVTDKLERQSQRYVGKTAEVVVNPETGKIISVNPTSTKKAARLIKQQGE